MNGHLFITIMKTNGINIASNNVSGLDKGELKKLEGVIWMQSITLIIHSLSRSRKSDRSVSICSSSPFREVFHNMWDLRCEAYRAG